MQIHFPDAAKWTVYLDRKLKTNCVEITSMPFFRWSRYSFKLLLTLFRYHSRKKLFFCTFSYYKTNSPRMPQEFFIYLSFKFFEFSIFKFPYLFLIKHIWVNWKLKEIYCFVQILNLIFVHVILYLVFYKWNDLLLISTFNTMIFHSLVSGWWKKELYLNYSARASSEL